MNVEQVRELRRACEALRADVVFAAHGRPGVEVMRLGRFAERLIDMLAPAAELFELAEQHVAAARSALSEEIDAGRGTWAGGDR